jgi:hypothetical protein
MGSTKCTKDPHGPSPNPDADGNEEMDTTEPNTENKNDPQDDCQESADDGAGDGDDDDVDDLPDDDSLVLRRELVRDFYETVIGLNRKASFALYIDENMTKAADFRCVKPEVIEKICVAIRKTHKTPIPITAMDLLSLL